MIGRQETRLWLVNLAGERTICPTKLVVWLLLGGMVFGLTGCGAGGSGSDGGSTPDELPAEPADEEVGQPDFTFAEDQDPALAAQAFEPDQLLVRALPGADADDLRAAYAQAGAQERSSLAALQLTVLEVEPDQFVAVAAALSENPLFEAVQKNYVYETQRAANDTLFDQQQALTLLNLPAAWDTTVGSSQVIIAVLDSGVAADHPDLADKLTVGWNTVDDNSQTDDVFGHGTEVASVAAAATNNRLGIAGVSWNSPVMPVRVSNEQGQASTRSIAAAMVWAVDHGAKVLNVSFAPLASDRTVLRAARYVRSSGCVVLISAGNDGQAWRSSGSDDAIFVGAVDEQSELAWFSSTGPFVDLVAPGVGIATAASGPASGTASDGGYQLADGTSFSAPLAAGVAALVWSARPQLSPTTVEQILVDTAVDLGPTGRDDLYGAGLIDAAAAVEAALAVTASGAADRDRRSPTISITRPADQTISSGIVLVTAEARDDTDVAQVVLSVDGQPFATDDAEPYRFVINTAQATPGPHTLSCVATDLAGNTSAADNVVIIVESPTPDDQEIGEDAIAPQVIINFPVTGTEVVSQVGLQATATDNLALASATWFVDGRMQRAVRLSGTYRQLAFNWDASWADAGEHIVSIQVVDANGNRSRASVPLIKR